MRSLKGSTSTALFRSLLAEIGRLGTGRIVYRGLKDAAYALTPKFGRSPHDRVAKDWRENEHALLDMFIERARPLVAPRPDSTLEWLAVAQHHGLPTRLLDWTRNPLVAAYFAVEGSDSTDPGDATDGALVAFSDPDDLKSEFLKSDADPFSVPICALYKPHHITHRITAQSGLFTIHPNPYEDFADERITRIIIPKHARAVLKFTLYRFGIHRAAMFPDLGGIAAHADWVCLKKKSTAPRAKR